MNRTSDGELVLESKLAGFVRSYIDASQSGEHSQAEEALQWACTGLEYLLGSLLDKCDDWHGGWVDGIIAATDSLPDAVKVVSQVDFTVRGRAIWLDAKRCCIEPFHGSVRIAERGDALIGYEICFADAARGLARIPYDKHIRWPEWYFPAQWLFVFSKGTLAKKSVVEAPR